MQKIQGNINGLKAQHLKKLGNFFKRKIPPEMLISPEIARDMGEISQASYRQIGLLIDRAGMVRHVIAGDADSLFLPNLEHYRYGPGRLKGLRLVHTHLKGEGLGDEDITDLIFLRLDLMAAFTLTNNGLPDKFHVAHLLRSRSDEKPYRKLEPFGLSGLDMAVNDFVAALEDELVFERPSKEARTDQPRALLVSVSSGPRARAAQSMAELTELARSSRVQVAGTMIQQRKKPDPRFLLGRGKLEEVAVMALVRGADMLIFDSELNPSQIRAITDRIELPVIDRTQLILDIFAQRAATREGKLQVELAQLKYMLPRLVGKNTALSRLAGGIGGRGPGETKLEMDRRKVRERIRLLERDLSKVADRRAVQRSRRDKKGLPVVSIVGYTNAGKSTLLNTLTHAAVLAESRMFATLDPSSRRLRFPKDREIIITDTVGFIEDLPKDLKVAFRATLEELDNADLLLHVMDAASPRLENQIASVEKILEDLKLSHKKTLRVLNKSDLLPPEESEALVRRLNGIPICALDRKTLAGLIGAIEDALFNMDRIDQPGEEKPEREEPQEV
jgi:GTP-binding protein HflX